MSFLAKVSALVAVALIGGLPQLAQAQPGLAKLAAVAPVAPCESLAKADLTRAVGAPVTVASAAVTKVGAAEYCIVRGTIAPKNTFEVRLPVKGWTQRYLQIGCGGLCGNLRIPAEIGHADRCAPANNHELVLASTDMGHSGPGAEFGDDPQARIDFAYRGVHVTAVAAKALIRAYYGRPQRFAYFSGCSDGGREGLIEAQRYPEDFDGITAGAPAMNFQVQNTFYHGWNAVSNTGADGRPILVASKLPALHAAAMASCDAVDGLKDGQIDDPRACRFDPAAAQCPAGAAATDACLTAQEVAVARKLYAGAHGADGERFVMGGPQVGSELSWRGVYVPATREDGIFSTQIAAGTIGHVAFETNPPADFKLSDFRFDRATFDRLRPLHALYDATDTDLSAFARRGGKLLMWHGWSDPHISPINTIAYYEGVERHLGAAQTADTLRLFLFPGLYHCEGGDGLSQFDVLTPLMAWVEGRVRPDVILAGRAAGSPQADGPRPPMDQPKPKPQITRTRPVFAYPAVARYQGAGSVDSAASFVQAAPAIPSPGRYDWAGADFIAPGFQKACLVRDGKLVCDRAPTGR